MCLDVRTRWVIQGLIKSCKDCLHDTWTRWVIQGLTKSCKDCLHDTRTRWVIQGLAERCNVWLSKARVGWTMSNARLNESDARWTNEYLPGLVMKRLAGWLTGLVAALGQIVVVVEKKHIHPVPYLQLRVVAAEVAVTHGCLYARYRLQHQPEKNVITTVSRSTVSSLSLRPTLASHSDTWLSLYTLLPLASHWRQCYQVTVTQGCLCTRYWLQYLPEYNVSKSQWNMAAVSMHPTVSSFSLKKALKGHSEIHYTVSNTCLKNALKGHSDIHYTVSNTCLKTLPMRYRDTHSCLQHQLENNVTKSLCHTLPSPVSSWRQRYQVRMTHVTVSSIVMKTTLPSQNDTRYCLQYHPEDSVTKSLWHTLLSPVSSWRQRYQVTLTHVTVSSISLKTTLPSHFDTRYRLQYQPEDSVTKSLWHTLPSPVSAWRQRYQVNVTHSYRL